MKFLNEFKEFITKGNIIDLAVAVVIGSSFGSIISLVSVFLFIYIIYRTLTDNVIVSSNY